VTGEGVPELVPEYEPQFLLVEQLYQPGGRTITGFSSPMVIPWTSGGCCTNSLRPIGDVRV